MADSVDHNPHERYEVRSVLDSATTLGKDAMAVSDQLEDDAVAGSAAEGRPNPT